MIFLIFAMCCFSGYMIGISIAGWLGVGSHKDVLDGVEIWPRR